MTLTNEQKIEASQNTASPIRKPELFQSHSTGFLNYQAKVSTHSLVERIQEGIKSGFSHRFYDDQEKTVNNFILQEMINNLESDIGEVTARQDIFKSFSASPNVEIKTLFSDYKFPSIPVGFLEYVNSSNLNNFYSSVDDLKTALELISEKKPSERIGESIRFLKYVESQKNSEKNLVETILDEAKKQESHRGVVEINFTRFSNYESNVKFVSESGLAVKRNEDIISDGSINDLSFGVNDLIKKDLLNYFVQKLEDARKSMRNSTSFIPDSAKISVAYSYSGEGLLDMELFVKELKGEFTFGETMMDEPFLSDVNDRIKKQNSNWAKKKILNYQVSAVGSAIERVNENYLKQKLAGFLSPDEPIKASNFEQSIVGSSLKLLLKKYEPQISHFKKLHEDYLDLHKKFRDVYELMSYFNHLSEDFNYMEPLETGNTIEIKNMSAPFLVFNSSKDVVPNDVSAQNLNIVSGPNNEGKSIFREGIVDSIIMTQVGLPIPADSGMISLRNGIFLHALNPKAISEGVSTYTSTLKHLRETIEKLPYFKNAHISLDELEAGTEQVGAEPVSQLVLDYFNGLKSSGQVNTYVITQNSAWARKLQERDFPAQFLKVSDYKISEGIGKSNAFALAKKIGLTEEFVSELLDKFYDPDPKR